MTRELIAHLVIYHEPISPVNQYKACAIKQGKRWTARMYMDSKFTKYQTLVKNTALKYVEEIGLEPYDGLVEVEANFYYGTRRRKDLPNAGKLEFDAFNGVIWKDDSQIVKLRTEKRYDKENPKTEIKVYKTESEYWTIN